MQRAAQAWNAHQGSGDAPPNGWARAARCARSARAVMRGMPAPPGARRSARGRTVKGRRTIADPVGRAVLDSVLQRHLRARPTGDGRRSQADRRWPTEQADRRWPTEQADRRWPTEQADGAGRTATHCSGLRDCWGTQGVLTHLAGGRRHGLRLESAKQQRIRQVPVCGGYIARCAMWQRCNGGDCNAQR